MSPPEKDVGASTEKMMELQADATCSSHSACSELDGDCCPTAEGVFLDCCYQTCAAHSQCSDLEGNCCPTDDGVVLDCCDFDGAREEGITDKNGEGTDDKEDLGSCAEYPACVALGLTGECCPSIEGVLLDCCKPQLCAANSGCAALELEGDCCPTADDVYLDCCSNTPVIDGKNGDDETEKETDDLGASCEKNPVCVLQGVEGECCPTAEGVFLDCCNRECSVHSACEENSLDAACCPTADGVELECCDHQPKIEEIREAMNANKLCSAHSLCANLDGDCCPTTAGVFLDCCQE